MVQQWFDGLTLFLEHEVLDLESLMKDTRRISMLMRVVSRYKSQMAKF